MTQPMNDAVERKNDEQQLIYKQFLELTALLKQSDSQIGCCCAHFVAELCASQDDPLKALDLVQQSIEIQVKLFMGLIDVNEAAKLLSAIKKL